MSGWDEMMSCWSKVLALSIAAAAPSCIAWNRLAREEIRQKQNRFSTHLGSYGDTPQILYRASARLQEMKQ